MWSDESSNHFGGTLDPSTSPYYSHFTDLRRIVCEEQLQQPAAALRRRSRRAVGVTRGPPAWLYLGNQWNWVTPSRTPPTKGSSSEGQAMAPTMAGTNGVNIMVRDSRIRRSGAGRPLRAGSRSRGGVAIIGNVSSTGNAYGSGNVSNGRQSLEETRLPGKAGAAEAAVMAVGLR